MDNLANIDIFTTEIITIEIEDGAVVLEIEEGAEQQSNFLCEICGSYLKTKHNLQSHQKTLHENYRPYACPECIVRIFCQILKKSYLNLNFKKN